MLTRILTVVLVAAAAPAAAQVIPVKTVPLATGDQFLIHPSEHGGMGGPYIAARDSLLDPFLNPAKGARTRETVLFGAPVLYLVSDQLGDGRTLPVGALSAGRTWFGGASLALQQLEGAERGGGRVLWDVWVPPSSDRLSDGSRTNLYASGLLGRRLGDGRTAVGLGLGYADLEALDGVDLLYARSERIEQDGSLADVRLGLVRELEGEQTLEIVLLHERLDMTHDITYRDWRWDTIGHRGVVSTRTERNEDRTRTWGAHLGYVRPLGEDGWRLGGTLTGNYKTHPKIPNYEIMNIPRDPGHTWAYDLGLGVARSDGPAALAMDVAFQPIWSHTWAEADTATRTVTGRILAPGEKTVENDFEFRNARVRLGVEREVERWGFQLGLEARSFRYRLEQVDHLTREEPGPPRTQRESWMEWTPTWGLGLFFPELRVRYAGRVTTGTGRPGVDVRWEGVRAGAVALAADFLVAPSGPLTLQAARVFTHQVTVSVPVR